MGIVKIEDLKELIIEIRGQSVLLDSVEKFHRFDKLKHEVR